MKNGQGSCKCLVGEFPSSKVVKLYIGRWVGRASFLPVQQLARGGRFRGSKTFSPIVRSLAFLRFRHRGKEEEEEEEKLEHKLFPSTYCRKRQ